MTVRAPKGFKFIVDPRRGRSRKITISLVNVLTNKIIGDIDLLWIVKSYSMNPYHNAYDPKSERPKYKRFETHSHLREEFRGKGWGVLLYLKAIHVGQSRGLKICSSRAPSDDAIRVWTSRTLRNRYTIRKIGQRYHVY